MRVECNRESLRTAFEMAAAAAPSRSPKPILMAVLFRADGEGSTLTGTDLEASVSVRVLGCDVGEAGAVLLPVEAVRRVLATSDDVTLMIEADGDKVRISGLRSHFEFQVEDAALYPAPDGFTGSAYFTVAAADLRRAIKRTVFATDAESTRFSLGGVLAEVGDDTIRFVGTDGRRLSMQTIPCAREGSPQPTERPVLPTKGLGLLLKHLDDGDPPVCVAFESSGVVVRTDTAVLRTRLVEGRFPRYQDVFPSETGAKIPVQSNVLRRAVEHAAVAASEESRGIDFTFARGLLSLAASSVDRGRSLVEMPIEHEGATLSLTLDPQYVVQTLKAVGDEVPLIAEVLGPKSPFVISTPERDWMYVVMPLTRER